MTAEFHWGDDDIGHDQPGYSLFAGSARSPTESRASSVDLSARPGGRRLRVIESLQATGRKAGYLGSRIRPFDPLGPNPSIRQVGFQGSDQSQRGQARTSRSSTPRPAADRPP